MSCQKVSFAYFLPWLYKAASAGVTAINASMPADLIGGHSWPAQPEAFALVAFLSLCFWSEKGCCCRHRGTCSDFFPFSSERGKNRARSQ